MQIQCHNCHNSMTVNPQGGSFQCPACHALNVVAAQVPQGIPVQAQYMAAPPKPKQDNRKAYVFAGFLGLGFVGIGMGWSGLLLGLPLLAWGIAGALGKVKSPGALVWPESADKSGIGALSIGLGAFVMTCSIMGGTTADTKTAKDEKLAQAKIEKAAADKVAKEEKEAAEAAAKAAHKAELLANVGNAATAYKTGMDAVEALMGGGKIRQASAKLEKVATAVSEYEKLDPVPETISALGSRYAALKTKVEAALKIAVATDGLEKGLSEAASLTNGSKDGAAWSTAQGLWRASLKHIDTLESAGAGEGLPAKRAAIEKNLKMAESIVAKYEKKQAAQAAKQAEENAAREAYRAVCGDEGCVEVTATQLLKDYAANEAGAQARWGGKRVAVSGTVESISLDLFDNVVVSIRGKNRYSFANVMCDPENESAANTLRKGQKIVAYGTIGSEIIGSVGLDDCTF